MKIISLFILFTILIISIKAQVHLPSGSAIQSYPILNYEDAKTGLSLNMGLFYSSGNGLMVAEEETIVGQSWNINNGGIIVRVQQGEPDDQKEFNNGVFDARKTDNSEILKVLKNYPNGYLYNTNVGKGCNDGLSHSVMFGQRKIYKDFNKVTSDQEQDRFMFNFNGKSGTFVIMKDKTIKVLGDNRLKISFEETDMLNQNIRTTISKFTVISDEGIKYTFSDLGLTHITYNKITSIKPDDDYPPENTYWANTDKFNVNHYFGFKADMSENPYVVSSWSITNIENSNTNKKIDFVYDDILEDQIPGHKSIYHGKNLNKSNMGRTGKQWYSFLTQLADQKYQSMEWETQLFNNLHPSTIDIYFSHNVGRRKQLKKIIFPSGNNCRIFLFNI